MTSLPERKADSEFEITGTASTIVKHSVRIAGHQTSISLECKFWDLLKQMAKRRDISLNELITEIDQKRVGNVSSAIRLYVLDDLIQKTQK
ncbi:MAG: ribbon-helix-helix domain-containing protein [Sneathiella sp.]|nr:ribbon-helix-helix domain-containing protein [Sneathiella sp.]